MILSGKQGMHLSFGLGLFLLLVLVPPFSAINAEENKQAAPKNQTNQSKPQDENKLTAAMSAENQAAGRVPFDDDSDCD